MLLILEVFTKSRYYCGGCWFYCGPYCSGGAETEKSKGDLQVTHLSKELNELSEQLKIELMDKKLRKSTESVKEKKAVQNKEKRLLLLILKAAWMQKRSTVYAMKSTLF